MRFFQFLLEENLRLPEVAFAGTTGDIAEPLAGGRPVADSAGATEPPDTFELEMFDIQVQQAQSRFGLLGTEVSPGIGHEDDAFFRAGIDTPVNANDLTGPSGLMGVLENKVSDLLAGQGHIYTGADTEEIIVVIVKGHVIDSDAFIYLKNVTAPALLLKDLLKDAGDLFRIAGHRLIEDETSFLIHLATLPFQINLGAAILVHHVLRPATAEQPGGFLSNALAEASKSGIRIGSRMRHDNNIIHF